MTGVDAGVGITIVGAVGVGVGAGTGVGTGVGVGITVAGADPVVAGAELLVVGGMAVIGAGATAVRVSATEPLVSGKGADPDEVEEEGFVGATLLLSAIGLFASAIDGWVELLCLGAEAAVVGVAAAGALLLVEGMAMVEGAEAVGTLLAKGVATICGKAVVGIGTVLVEVTGGTSISAVCGISLVKG